MRELWPYLHEDKIIVFDGGTVQSTVRGGTTTDYFDGKAYVRPFPDPGMAPP